MYRYRIGTRGKRSLLLAALLIVLLSVTTATRSDANSRADDFWIYRDSLANGWFSQSWDTAVDFNHTGQVKAGSRSTAITHGNAWTGFKIVTGDRYQSNGYDGLEFWAHGGVGGQVLDIVLKDGNDGDANVGRAALTNSWQKYTVDFTSTVVPDEISGMMLVNTKPGAQPTYYLDEVRLLEGTNSNGGTPPPPPSPTATYNLSIDLSAPLHNINPDIYGINFSDEALMESLNIPVRRWGGNALTRYNWELDVSHTGSDYFFLNYPSPTNEAQLPNNSSADRYIQTNESVGARSLMTIPTIGWTAKARAFDCGFRVSKYGAQQATEQWNPDCGNGIRPNGEPVTGVDPTDTSRAVDEQFAKRWVQHLVSRFGNAASGGVSYYALDNEPMLWNHTHRDVRPDPVGYDDLRDRAYTYGAAIKEADPTAKVFGPVLWGPSAYYYSAIDAASGNWDNPPDRLAHGDVPLVDWYLREMKRYEQQNGTRILDYLDLHFYPQQSGVALQTAGDLDTQRRRLRATRSLWDATYVDESWIANTVEPRMRMVPRMRDWVNQNYPGTKIALTEYNYGGLEHINGAIAQADVLGIFARERLDLATLWDPPLINQPGAFAFRMFRNYDGNGSTFGDQYLRSTSSNQGQLSVYGAKRSSDGKITVMVVNKSMASVLGNLSFPGYQAGITPTEVYQYSRDDLRNIHQSGTSIGPNGFTSYVFRADSITLFVFDATPSNAPIYRNYLPAIQSRAGVIALMSLPATLLIGMLPTAERRDDLI